MPDLEIVEGELDDLIGLEEGLTDWEVEFLESVNRQFEIEGRVTQKQADKLHEIWVQRCT